MSLSPQEVINKSFQNVRRGYDPDEVKAFLEQIASEGVNGGDESVTKSQGNDVDAAAEEIRTVLTAARAAAAKLKESSEKEAQALVDEAGDKAADQKRGATQEATATLEDAKTRAEQLVEEAKAYAQEQRSIADRERKDLLDGAVRHHEQLMTQERELQEAANRAEKALQDLRSALRSEQERGPGRDQPGIDPKPEQQPSPQVIELESQPGRQGDRERQVR